MWLACRRGTEYSRSHETFDLSTDEGLKDYFNYDTQAVGVEDMPAFVDLVNATVAEENTFNCGNKVQIFTHGLGAAEAMAGIAANETLSANVNQLSNLAPCLVSMQAQDFSGSSNDEEAGDQSSSEEDEEEDNKTTYGYGKWRVLSDLQDGITRGRELGDYNSQRWSNYYYRSKSEQKKYEKELEKQAKKAEELEKKR